MTASMDVSVDVLHALTAAGEQGMTRTEVREFLYGRGSVSAAMVDADVNPLLEAGLIQASRVGGYKGRPRTVYRIASLGQRS